MKNTQVLTFLESNIIYSFLFMKKVTILGFTNWITINKLQL